MSTFMCGPNEPTAGDLAMVELFKRWLTGDLSLDEYDTECAKLEGINATQEGTDDGIKPH